MTMYSFYLNFWAEFESRFTIPAFRIPRNFSVPIWQRIAIKHPPVISKNIYSEVINGIPPPAERGDGIFYDLKL